MPCKLLSCEQGLNILHRCDLIIFKCISQFTFYCSMHCCYVWLIGLARLLCVNKRFELNWIEWSNPKGYWELRSYKIITIDQTTIKPFAFSMAHTTYSLVFLARSDFQLPRLLHVKSCHTSVHTVLSHGWVLENSYVIHVDYRVTKWKHFLRYWSFVRGIHRWIPLTKASYAERWCFLWYVPEQTVE